MLDRLEPVIASQEANITATIPDPELNILGDRFYWTQVLFNLVENAIKQNQRHKIEVEIGARREAGGALTIWVSDNGVGIPSADLPFIFRRFYRVEKHHSQEGIKGTGLGLSIVKRAVEAHRGHIEVSSTPGHETRFLITLPEDVSPDITGRQQLF